MLPQPFAFGVRSPLDCALAAWHKFELVWPPLAKLPQATYLRVGLSSEGFWHWRVECRPQARRGPISLWMLSCSLASVPTTSCALCAISHICVCHRALACG